MNHKKFLIIGVLVGLSAIVLIFQYSEILSERESDVIIPSTEALDRIVNHVILSCEIDGECDTLSGWLEVCKNEKEYKDVPSCHDGRIEKLIEYELRFDTPPIDSFEGCIAAGNDALHWYDEEGGWWGKCQTPDGKKFTVDCNELPRRCV